MKIIKTIAAAAALTLMAAQPAVAGSPAAQKLSLKNAVSSDVRLSGKAGAAKQAEGIPTLFLVLGAAVVIALVVIVASGDSSPNSP